VSIHCSSAILIKRGVLSQSESVYYH